MKTACSRVGRRWPRYAKCSRFSQWPWPCRLPMQPRSASFPTTYASATAADFAAKIPGHSFTGVDTLATVPTLPSLLAAYDVLLVFEDCRFVNSKAVGDVAAAFANAGRPVVLGTFYDQDRSETTNPAPEPARSINRAVGVRWKGYRPQHDRRNWRRNGHDRVSQSAPGPECGHYRAPRADQGRDRIVRRVATSGVSPEETRPRPARLSLPTGPSPMHVACRTPRLPIG